MRSGVPLSLRGRLAGRLLGLAWAFVVVGGFVALARYEVTPGAEAFAPTDWPSSTGIERAARGRPTLILFVHPKCPCTKATLVELAAALERHGADVEARVLFVRPPGVAPGWERAALWERASAMSGVSCLVDDAGAEAKRFDAQTSGQVLLFTAEGRLVFSGGITASRGYEGENAARSALERELRGAGRVVVRTPVFGCPLLDAPCVGTEDGRPR